MPAIEVVYQEIIRVAERMEPAREAIDAQLVRMEGALAELMDSGFHTHEASPKVMEYYLDFSDSAFRFFLMLNRWDEGLRAIADGFRETDEAVAKALTGGGKTSVSDNSTPWMPGSELKSH